MRDLKLVAQVYILSILTLGFVFLIGSSFSFELTDPVMAATLCLIASLSLILKVEGSTNRSHYNISFLIYAFTFIDYGLQITYLVILVSNIVDWIWHKYRWYIQTFNIANYLVTFYITQLAYRYMSARQSDFSFWGVSSILVAMAVFTLINHLLVGLVVWLARGENFAQSGIFKLFPLMLDYILLCMGAAAALLWSISPFSVVLVLLPLYLIYSTLKVPALERQSESDPKTGLFNAKYFERALQNELKRANRFDRPLTIVMADLDLLRNINNTYGHLAGDQVLIGVANILRASVREYDVVSRFGGEEYAILMPETTPEDAFPRIESIRANIEKAEFVVPTSVTPIQVTMSFGISGRSLNHNTAEQLVHNADAALYHAKLKGRNGTFIYSDEGFVNLHQGTTERSVVDPTPTTPLDQRIGYSTNSYRQSPLRSSPPAVDSRTPTTSLESPPKGQGLPISNRWRVNLYIGALFLVSLLLLSQTYHPNDNFQWLGLIMFGGMIIVTEWYSIEIYARNSAISTSAAPMLAGILLYGPLGAVFLSLVFGGVALIKHQSKFSRFIFNVANQLIASLIYLRIIQFTHTQYASFAQAPQFLFALFAVGIVYLVTTFFISIGISLDLEASPKEIWFERFSWLAPYYLAMGVIAYALVVSFQTAGVLGAMVILAPLLLLRYGQLQYLNRTRDIVNELKAKNEALQKSSEEIQKLNDGLLDTLAEVVDLRDPYNLRHSRQVAHYAVLLAKKLSLPKKQVELVRKAGLLHDIGKLGVSELILKKPAALTHDEFETVKQHVTLAADVLTKSYSLQQLIPIILHHHERFDGMGYPEGLRGNEIPVEARIIGLADAVEAMASDRPYHKGLSPCDIIEELRRNAGTQFDPLLVDTFIKMVVSDGNQLLVNLAVVDADCLKPRQIPQFARLR